jgi:hypothetical protein
LVVVMAMLLVLGPWWRKRRRAARRRSDQDPAARVAGAWLEAMDRLGSDVSTRDAHHRSSAAVDERFGPDHTAPLHDLGPLVNRALHAADPPADEVATEAWALSDAFAAEVRKTQSRPDRLRASLDRRPLADANNGGG